MCTAQLWATPDSNLSNPKPNPNPNLLTLTVTFVHSLIRTDQTHHPHKLPLCFQKYIIISVDWLLICIVLRIAKTDIVSDDPACNQCVLIKTLSCLNFRRNYQHWLNHKSANIELCLRSEDIDHQSAGPCGLQGCKNRPAPFPGRMSYKATKPGLVLFYILACFNCIVAY